MTRVVVIAVVIGALLFVLGVDVLHCVVGALAALTAGVTIRVVGRVPGDVEPPDPLLIPYGTTLLRSYAFSGPHSSDPVGEYAGRRAAQVCAQALAEHPDDPVLGPIAEEWGEQWRLLPQRTMSRMLDRVDQLRAHANANAHANADDASDHATSTQPGRKPR